jgi:hypothetical protein
MSTLSWSLRSLAPTMQRVRVRTNKITKFGLGAFSRNKTTGDKETAK